MNLTLIIVIIYVSILLFVGFFIKKSIKNIDDYVLGGRNISWFLITASLAANDIGAGASIGIVQDAAQNNSFQSVWYVWLMIPSYFFGFFIAPYIRRTNARTVPEYIGKKYDNLAKYLSSLFLVIPNIGIIAINLTASASIIQILISSSFVTALIIATTVTLIYSYLGGLWADVITDFIQIFTIVFGLAIILFILFISYPIIDFKITPFLKVDDISITKNISLIVLYTTNFIVGLSTSTRILASKNEASAKKGILYCIPLYLIYGVVPVLIGLYLGKYGVKSYELSTIFNFFLNNFPFYISSLLFIGIISASLSTVDTLLLSCSTVIFNDLIEPLNSKVSKLSEKNKLLSIRLLLVFIALLATVVSFIGFSSVINFLVGLLITQSIVVFSPFVFAMFRNISDAKSGFVSMCISLLTYLVLKFNPFWEIQDTFILIPCLVISMTYLTMKNNNI